MAPASPILSLLSCNGKGGREGRLLNRGAARFEFRFISETGDWKIESGKEREDD